MMFCTKESPVGINIIFIRVEKQKESATFPWEQKAQQTKTLHNHNNN